MARVRYWKRAYCFPFLEVNGENIIFERIVLPARWSLLAERVFWKETGVEHPVVRRHTFPGQIGLREKLPSQNPPGKSPSPGLEWHQPWE